MIAASATARSPSVIRRSLGRSCRCVPSSVRSSPRRARGARRSGRPRASRGRTRAAGSPRRASRSSSRRRRSRSTACRRGGGARAATAATGRPATLAEAAPDVARAAAEVLDDDVDRFRGPSRADPRGSGRRSSPSQSAATSRASADHREQVDRFIVGVTSSTWSTSGRTSASGVPGSSPSGRSMIPEWSVPSPISSSARIIPRETSPRSGRSSSGPGSRAGARRAGRRRPSRRRRSSTRRRRSAAARRSPTSTWQSWSRSAFGCVSAASTRPTTKCPRLPSSSATPTSITRSTSSDEIESRRAISCAVAVVSTYSRSQESGNLHQNCLEKRRSLRQSSRRSGNSCRSIAMRSRPQPEREARVALGVVADELEELRVDHPGAARPRSSPEWRQTGQPAPSQT